MTAALAPAEAFDRARRHPRPKLMGVPLGMKTGGLSTVVMAPRSLRGFGPVTNVPGSVPCSRGANRSRDREGAVNGRRWTRLHTR